MVCLPLSLSGAAKSGKLCLVFLYRSFAELISRYIATFQITKILDATLTEKDEIDLQKAEELTKRFLLWNIDEENTDVMDILKELLDMDEEEEMQVEAQEQTSSDVELGEVTEVDSGGEEDRMMDRGW